MIDSKERITILKQVDEFYKKTAREIQKARYYVDTDVAEEIASFFGKVYENKEYTFDRIMDMTFGSANLTSHILLDNNIDFETLVLNDKNLDDANLDIEIGEKTNLDILEYDLFDNYEPFDLVIFNPQLGGSAYAAGKLETDSALNKDSFCIHKLELNIEEALKEKFDLSNCEVAINPDQVNEHKIFIYSDKLTQTQMNSRFGKLQIFNYYDVFYQAEGSEVIGKISEIVKFRKTLEKISHDNTIIVFLGDNKDYNMFFADFNNYSKYNTRADKSIFVASKAAESKKECYEKTGEGFSLVDCDKENIDEISLEDIDLFKLLDDISEDLAGLKNLNGSELGIKTSNSVIKTESLAPNSKSTSKQKPFKNFLLDYIIKETK